MRLLQSRLRDPLRLKQSHISHLSKLRRYRPVHATFMTPLARCQRCQLWRPSATSARSPTGSRLKAGVWGLNRSGWRKKSTLCILDKDRANSPRMCKHGRQLDTARTSWLMSPAESFRGSKRAIRHREAILAPLKTLSGKRANSFRPRFTANNRSRPLQKQAAQALVCPFGRALSDEAVRCVPVVASEARATSLVGLMRSCSRPSP